MAVSEDYDWDRSGKGVVDSHYKPISNVPGILSALHAHCPSPIRSLPFSVLLWAPGGWPWCCFVPGFWLNQPLGGTAEIKVWKEGGISCIVVTSLSCWVFMGRAFISHPSSSSHQLLCNVPSPCSFRPRNGNSFSMSLAVNLNPTHTSENCPFTKVSWTSWVP